MRVLVAYPKSTLGTVPLRDKHIRIPKELEAVFLQEDALEKGQATYKVGNDGMFLRSPAFESVRIRVLLCCDTILSAEVVAWCLLLKP
jgi:hypothetical protein